MDVENYVALIWDMIWEQAVLEFSCSDGRKSEELRKDRSLLVLLETLKKASEKLFEPYFW